MAANTGRLAGRTIFVSGGSRGIGLAIAKKCARDGANIVLAAKTAAPHPKLPGTIYTAAKEIEDAGGKCLPCIVDIQHEDQIQKAVDETVSKFGGIDILVNNASAINLTGTQATPMKKYDLMMGINTRGTYLCSKLCLPALQKGVNPHILNISPPLNMSAKWFKNHVAYTMAKYGMSMCVLGMSEEFREDGIAVNALWPRTAIWTAAMAMLGGGDAMEAQCRTDAIMADAAYVMLSKDSKQYTGNFAVDDEVLSQEGVKDFEQYACVKGNKLLPDFFLDVGPEDLVKQMEEGGAKPAFVYDEKSPEPSGGDLSGPAATFKAIENLISPELINSIKGTFAFDLKDGGKWYLDLANAPGSAGQGEPPSGKSGCTMTMSPEDFSKMFSGKLNPTQAFMSGKLKIKGDLALAMKLEKLMKQMNKSKL